MELGIPAQELSFFMYFHLEPSLRKSFELDVLKHYYDKLISLGVSQETFSFEECKYQYEFGGFAKFVMYFPFLTKMLPMELIKYTGAQMIAFAKDHGITKENVTMVYH